MKSIPQIALLVAAVLAGTIQCLAVQRAVLRNGFDVPYDHHAVIGATTRLYLTPGESDYLDIATIDIDHFEMVPDAPPATTASSSTTADVVPDTDGAIHQASTEQQIDPALIRAIIRAESAFHPKAISKKGAQGLMQLMPQTAKSLGVKDTFDPQQNVSAGVKYFNDLLARYHYNLVKALAAYNAGAGAVDRYRGVPPYRETHAYVARIVHEFNREKRSQRNAARAAAKGPSPEIRKESGSSD